MHIMNVHYYLLEPSTNNEIKLIFWFLDINYSLFSMKLTRKEDHMSTSQKHVYNPASYSSTPASTNTLTPSTNPRNPPRHLNLAPRPTRQLNY